MAERCEAEAKKGTGTGVCDTPLDNRDQCSRERWHIENERKS